MTKIRHNNSSPFLGSLLMGKHSVRTDKDGKTGYGHNEKQARDDLSRQLNRR